MNLRTPTFALTVLLLACAPKGEHGGVVIYQVCSPPRPDSSTGSCTFPSGSCSTVPLDTFAFDVGGAGTDTGSFKDMFLGIEVHNQLLDNTAADAHGTNTHTATIDRYTVTYSGISARNTNVNVAYTVPPSGSAVIGVRLVDYFSAADMAKALATSGYTRVVAHLQLHGHFYDGSYFDTAEQAYGIEVCAGCIAPPTCPGGAQATVCPPEGVYQFPFSLSCTGNGGSSGFTIGGTIENLSSGTLVLYEGISGQFFTVDAPGSTFTFADGVKDGASYDVSVDTSPSGLACKVESGGSGTVSGADVTTVRIKCL